MEQIRLENCEPAAKEKIEIGLAESPQERQAVYRLRYRVYIEEMGRKLDDVDHKNKMIYDELDDWSILVYARIGGEIVGTTRLNIGQMADFPPYLINFFGMQPFHDYSSKSGFPNLCFSSKIMVTEVYRRRSQVTYLLVAKGYEISRDSQVQFLFGGSAPYVVPFYENLGFRRYTAGESIPDYGYLIPFVLVNEDVEHLRAVRSPLWRVARKRVNSGEAAQWFCTSFPQTQQFINSQLIGREELWKFIGNKLGKSPQELAPILNGLSLNEAQLFLHNFVVVNFRKGDQLIRYTDVTNEMFMVLDGLLELKRPESNKRFKLLLPGQVCGENALVAPGRHGINILAATDCEVLVLPLQAFDRLKQTYPAVAAKVLRNILNLND